MSPVEQHRDQTRVEQGDVDEQSEGVQLGGDEQERRQESTGPSEQGDGPRVVAKGKQQGRGRHQGHQQKGDGLRYEAVEIVGGVNRKVEDTHARPGQAQSEYGHAAPMEPVAASGQQQAGHSAQDHTRRLVQPVVVEGVFQEKSHAEDEGEGAHAI